MPSQQLSSEPACSFVRGCTEPGVARRQAAVSSSEMSRVVVHRIIPVEAGEKADTLARVEGSNPVSGTARRAGYHRGLRRAEHVVRGETRELGRACALLVITTGRGGVPVDQEPWRWRRASAP